jgi:hypothetical protein
MNYEYSYGHFCPSRLNFMPPYAGNEQQQPGPCLGFNAGAFCPEPRLALSAGIEAGAEQIAAFRLIASQLISHNIPKASHSQPVKL